MKRLLRWWWLLIPVAVLLYLVLWYHQWQHWLSYGTGSYDTKAGLAAGTPHHYNAFSGSLSDVAELTLVTGLWANAALLWRKHTCHYAWWCWRHPHYNLEGTPFMLCHKHHPDGGVGNVKDVINEYVSSGGTDAQAA